MKKYSYLIIVCILASVSACSDSFFDLDPSQSVPQDKVYKTAQEFDLAVIGCYGYLRSQVSFYNECCEYRSDNMTMLAPTAGQQDLYNIAHFRETAANTLLEKRWLNFNEQVHACNLILDQIDERDINNMLKKQYKAEALYLRAYAYFNMYRVWGGVPTTRKVVNTLESLKIKRSSDQEMYDLIAGDLKEIIDNNMLPLSYKGDGVGRVTEGAVRALLGKVYLTFKRYPEARDVLSELIGKYSLQQAPADVFDVNNKMNSEIIFAVRFNKNLAGHSHDYWITRNKYPDSPTKQLLASYTDPADKRKELISYVNVDKNEYILAKFYDTKSSTTNGVGNDQILIRYADVLLMYAEALNEISYNNLQDSPALRALNEVHTRAGLTPILISSLPDKEAFRKALLVERQQEFPFEGHRWFDLVRMGYAKEVIAETGISITDDQLLFPIPQSVIERIGNKSLVWQNPSY